MNNTAKFGPGGNSALFAAKGHKSSLDAPAWVVDMGLDAYEYECGKGVNASLETFASIGLRACERAFICLCMLRILYRCPA